MSFKSVPTVKKLDNNFEEYDDSFKQIKENIIKELYDVLRNVLKSIYSKYNI